ncbi:amino acid ABC transporter substrate-binding protein [Lentilactobacillus buchneri]|uniref:amino acid ABC transporter substrate-binding protein n=1 Tax=Lentilactobacillus buchneri TaxID=1581 RepID=UPI000207603C|nr:amino acid ABC transporter substrate-binding protein [Lentilactobacillus buchneri]AEB73165.1 ABC-type transporter, periplasmic subunit family 3 [Lentilactobacillus buchneri NRRL B-30929]MQM82367.1 amino acid ABC transporter substrate-binding protein [Lentilactobacillus buchneri]
MLKSLKRLLLITSLLLVTIGLSGCGVRYVSRQGSQENPDTWSTVSKQKRIVVGLDDSFVPMGFQTKSGKIVGYDVDLARAVFKQYGIKVDFQPIDWSMNVTELRNGTIDLIWNGFSINPQRAKKITFSEPYLINDQVLVSKKNQHINSFADMKGKVAGVQSGSAGAMDIDNQPKLLKDKIKGHEPILYDTFTDAFIDLNANRIQGLLIDSIYAGYYLEHQPNQSSFKSIPSEFPKEEYGVGMRKGDTVLKRKIDQGLNRLAKNGELHKINMKWFGTDRDSPLIKNTK